MKLHWGNAIFIFFVVYISILGFTLYQSTQVDHSLVAEDYYAKDLSYQEQYEKLENYAASSKPLSLLFDSEKELISIHAPEATDAMTGTVTFYHPSRSNQDVNIAFSVSGGDKAAFSIPELSPGRWIAQVDYKDSKQSYYFEKDIFVR